VGDHPNPNFNTTTFFEENRLTTLDDPVAKLKGLGEGQAEAVLLLRIRELEEQRARLVGEKRRLFDQNNELKQQMEELRASLFIRPGPVTITKDAYRAFGRTDEPTAPSWTEAPDQPIEFKSKVPACEVFDLLDEDADTDETTPSGKRTRKSEQVVIPGSTPKGTPGPIPEPWVATVSKILKIPAVAVMTMLEMLRDDELTLDEEITIHNLFVAFTEDTKFPVDVPEDFIPVLKTFLQRCT
jgi:hypothetical protein